MVLNFDELNKGASQKQTDPRKLFTTLDRHARFKRPLDEQSDVLDSWFLKRERQDTTIKMNTGAGKTLVGLLALQSSINEGIFPAVFVTPDNYLVSQVVKEAKDLGIRTTEEADSPDFIAGRAILVINIMKLINGRSVFGVAAEGTKIKIGAIVIDDAHACLQTVAEQFSLVLKNNHPVYKELFKLFKEELSDQSRFEFLSVEAEDPNALVKVPFWSWSNKYAEVSSLLHKHRHDDDIKFAFPLIADVIRLCHCVIGGKRLEIAPNHLPIDVIPAFARAQRRIYMTATLADDGILVSHFNAKPEFASDPIKPKGVGDMGDRMILAPQEVNPKITRQEIKALVSDVAKTKNVVVIVPSARSADFWNDTAALTLDRTNIGQGIDQLKRKHIGLVVLINKYDGVDLPDDACRLLVIDGVPEVYGLIERTEMAALAGTEIEITRQVQRIEQGMGRGVRSSDDYCVVLLVGSRLSRRVHSPSAREKFNSSTLAQIDLGIAVTLQVRGKPVTELRPVLDLCLNQDANWRKTSRNALVNATEPAARPIDPVVIGGRAAFDLARSRDFPKAAETMRAAVDVIEDAHTHAAIIWKQLPNIRTHLIRQKHKRFYFPPLS